MTPRLLEATRSAGSTSKGEQSLFLRGEREAIGARAGPWAGSPVETGQPQTRETRGYDWHHPGRRRLRYTTQSCEMPASAHPPPIGAAAELSQSASYRIAVRAVRPSVRRSCMSTGEALLLSPHHTAPHRPTPPHTTPPRPASTVPHHFFASSISCPLNIYRPRAVLPRRRSCKSHLLFMWESGARTRAARPRSRHGRAQHATTSPRDTGRFIRSGRRDRHAITEQLRQKQRTW